MLRAVAELFGENLVTKTVTKAVTKTALVTKTELSGEALRRHEAS